MNQILFHKNSSIQNNSIFEKNRRYKKQKIFFIIFYIAILLFVVLFIYFCYYLFSIYSKEQKANELAQSFSVKTLYNSNLNYSASLTESSESTQYESFIIGLVEIDKINLHYPILSYSSESNLKIGPCRFAGPLPNEIGNLCIAGHNYIDNSFFGKLRLLDYR